MEEQFQCHLLGTSFNPDRISANCLGNKKLENPFAKSPDQPYSASFSQKNAKLQVALTAFGHFFQALGKLHRKRLVEPVRPIGQADAAGQHHHLCRRQSFRQFLDYFRAGFSLTRPLVGETQHEFFQIVVSRALLKFVQIVNLGFAQAGLLTKAFMIVHSVVALVDLRRLEISELAELWVELFLNGLVEGERGLQYLRDISKGAKDIQHLTHLGLQVLENALGGFRGLGIGQRRDESHV